MGIKITRDGVLKTVSLALAVTMAYFDYLYIDTLVKDFLFFKEHPSLLKLWVTGAVGYLSINVMTYYVFKWSWWK